MTTRSGIDYDAFMAIRDDDRAFAYVERDTILYALAAGMGRDPLDPAELKFVYEGAGDQGEFVAMPTMAVVVARAGLARTLPINYGMVLHGEQMLDIHRPLPTAAKLLADTRIIDILDKGDKGAVIYHQTAARLTDTGEPLFTLRASLFARGDGGFGGTAEGGPKPHALPDRAPDLTIESETRADQALLYRLTGDRNPLHADPAAAKRAGFDRPILHGLCTYAVACRAVLAGACEYDPSRIAGFDVRFTSPVMPGDTIATDLWIEKDVISFRCRVPARDITVLNNGRARLVV